MVECLRAKSTSRTRSSAFNGSANQSSCTSCSLMNFSRSKLRGFRTGIAPVELLPDSLIAALLRAVSRGAASSRNEMILNPAHSASFSLSATSCPSSPAPKMRMFFWFQPRPLSSRRPITMSRFITKSSTTERMDHVPNQIREYQAVVLSIADATTRSAMTTPTEPMVARSCSDQLRPRQDR